ncbi:MAG: hypothetical protein FGM52_16615 [Mycobacterium sp.]|nr:hypothetical protein [Mycobacterium sp.]
MKPIPAIDTATDPIHSAEDMLQRWRALMGPLGFSERLLWIGFIGPDRCMHKVLSQVPVGSSPHRDLVENLMGALMVLLDENFEPGTSVALLLTRPGGDPVSGADRRWGTALRDAAARLGVPIEPVFRANDAAIAAV